MVTDDPAWSSLVHGNNKIWNAKQYFLIFSVVTVCLITPSPGQRYYQVRERPVPSGLPSTVTIKAWRGGMIGRIRVPITNDVINGWEMILHFPRKVLSLEVSSARIKDIGSFQKHYRIENEDYNPQLEAGTRLKLLFIARTYKHFSGLEGKIEFLPNIEEAGPMMNVSGETMGRNMTNNGGECSLTCGSQVDIVSQWPNNFEGMVTFYLDRRIRNGWNATLYFPQNRVTHLQIWNADRTGSYRDGPGTVIKIKNKPWNANIRGTFEFNFIVTIAEAVGHQFYAHMDGQPRCACSIEDEL